MVDPPAPRPPGVCHCRIIESDGRIIDCRGETSGPDDPFCWECSTRHSAMSDFYVGATITERPLGVPT